MVFDSLPEGSTKVETGRRILNMAHAKALLEDRKADYGVLVLMQKQYNIQCINRRIEETDSYIQAITEHRNAI